jgi:hypothetical protein
MSILKDRVRSGGNGGTAKEARYPVLDIVLTGLNGRKNSIVSIGAVRMEDGRKDLSDTFYRAGLRSAEDLVRPTSNFKGGDDRRFRHEYFAVLWGAIENVSPITGMNHAREVAIRAHGLCLEGFFDSSCRRVVIKCDPSPKVKERRQKDKKS